MSHVSSSLSRSALCLAVLWCGVTVLAGCTSTSYLDTETAGKTISYAPGLPNFDMELVPSERRGTPGINLHLGVPYRSLVFVQHGEIYGAEYALITQIYDGAGKHIIQSTEWSDSVEVSTYDQTQEYKLFSIDKRINLSPGEYVFRVVLQDRHSDKQAARLKRISVPAYGSDEPFLGHLFVEDVQGGSSEPIVSLHVPANLDSLRVVTEVNNTHSFGQVDVRMTVVRYHTDGELASPPYWLTPYAGSLRYEGVDYDERDTVSTSRYTLESLADRAQLKFSLPPLDRGVYRVNLTARLCSQASGRDSVVLVKSRDLSVKGPDFPSIAALDEVVEALAYIAPKGDLSRIRDADDVEEKRRRFDAFWGELARSRARGEKLLRTYYSRVEEANLFFTSHKEGWKTDRGMIYIVMGAPLYVEHYVDAEVWYYSYSQDPRRQFVFERVRTYHAGERVRFNNYVLQRRPYYEQTWRRALRRWREGSVL